MFYLEHSEPEPGTVGFARNFSYETLDEARAQALHDLSRPSTEPLVVGIRDNKGKLVLSRKDLMKDAS